MSDNTLTPFYLEKSSVRGRFVRIPSLAKDILARHKYPEMIHRTLTELIALSIALAGAFKYEGIFTLQVQGQPETPETEGAPRILGAPVRFMVVDVSSNGTVRACANFDEGYLSLLGKNPSIHALFRQGHLAYTIDQGENTERYQGIVELEGATLVECLQHYFKKSDQLETSFYVTSNADHGAVCVMLQKLPFDQEVDTDDYDGWFTANALLSTLKKEEALNLELPPEQLIHRMFWQEGLEVYDAKSFSFGCRCSRGKIEAVLATLPAEDKITMIKNGVISVSCDYCSELYVFEESEL
jgi:molecular chaperone Hsp33